MLRVSKAFTLVELLVALVVVGILATLAGPAFTGVFERTRADADSGNLVRALNMARLEAINRGTSITLQPVSGGGWDGALEVLVGANKIRSLPGMSTGATVSASDDPASIVFNNLGALDTPAGGTTFSYTRGNATKSVSVCTTGRIHTGVDCQ